MVWGIIDAVMKITYTVSEFVVLNLASFFVAGKIIVGSRSSLNGISHCLDDGIHIVPNHSKLEWIDIVSPLLELLDIFQSAYFLPKKIYRFVRSCIYALTKRHRHHAIVILLEIKCAAMVGKNPPLGVLLDKPIVTKDFLIFVGDLACESER